jgi:hypothetical protein
MFVHTPRNVCCLPSVLNHLLIYFSVADKAYPRQPICEALVTLIAQQPKVARDAISSLLDAGEAINTSASEAEQEFLINSSLSQEVFVRNACLQAMQVCGISSSIVILR